MGQVRASPHDSQAGPALGLTQPDSVSTDGVGLDFEDFFENGDIAFHAVDSNGVILRANKAEVALLGFSAAEYIGRPVAEFHVDSAAIEDILTRLKRGETLRKHPARLRARDGSIKHVEITASGRFSDGVFAHTRCVTVEADLKRVRDDIPVEEQWLRRVLDVLPAPV